MWHKDVASLMVIIGFRSFLSLITKITSLAKLFVALNMLPNICILMSVLIKWVS